MKKTYKLFSEYFQALIGAIVLAILIRGFVFEPFKIPSESMVPGLLVGDHIFVKRYEYGLRVPFTKYWLLEFEGPQRGDVVVFSFPLDEDVNYIKRIVGLPGDRIQMVRGELFINDQKVQHEFFNAQGIHSENQCWLDLEESAKAKVPEAMQPYPFHYFYKDFQPQIESFADGHEHVIQRSKKDPRETDMDLIVPDRHYFVLGDNRDFSQDSRFWGLLPRENLKGKALFIWLSINNEGIDCPRDLGLNIRWDRFGRKIL